MQQKTFRASGRIVVDNFHERFFLFVYASTHITLEGETIRADSLPESDLEFVKQLLDMSLDGRTIPAGFSSNPVEFPGFRIIRLIDESFEIVPPDIQLALDGPGDSSRAVTISGHVANDSEARNHDRLTIPTIVLEKLVPFETIQQRAFDISQSGTGSSTLDNWLRAERELLTST